MDFSALKKNRGSFNEKLQKKVEELNSGSGQSFKDDRSWNLITDKSGNGSAVIRFLMAPPGEDFPFVRYFRHSFKGPGGWYIENCPTTLGRDCPACDANSALWNTEIKANKDLASSRKRKLTYVSNILVVKDQKEPENDGKVMLFKYGQKIYNKINEMLNPDEETATEENPAESINPFDFWEGCNFQLKATKVAGYQNYDQSKFLKQTALFGGDDTKIQALWEKEYPLAEFVNPKVFLTYEELKKKLDKALGSGKAVSRSAEEVEPDDDSVVRRRATRQQAAKVEPESEPEEMQQVASEEDDEMLNYMAKLAAE